MTPTKDQNCETVGRQCTDSVPGKPPAGSLSPRAWGPSGFCFLVLLCQGWVWCQITTLGVHSPAGVATGAAWAHPGTIKYGGIAYSLFGVLVMYLAYYKKPNMRTSFVHLLLYVACTFLCKGAFVCCHGHNMRHTSFSPFFPSYNLHKKKCTQPTAQKKCTRYTHTNTKVID